MQVGQEAAPLLDVRMGHLVARGGALSGDLADSGHGQTLRSRIDPDGDPAKKAEH
jgi:hypothetical protein